MFCKNCGKEIDDRAAICVYCGVPTGEMEQTSVVPQKKVNGFGIAGFIVSLLSLYFGVYFLVVSIVGLALSIVGMVNKKKYSSCNGLAIAGLVLSIISLVFWVIIYVFAFAIILAMVGMAA